MSRFRSTLLAVAFLVTAPAVHGASIKTLFDTGVDASGAPSSNGAAELHYRLISVPSGTQAVRVATAANGYPIPPWIGDDAVSAWIGPNSDAALDGPGGQYDYRTTFDLSGYSASSAAITGRWAADNTGVDIRLNGVSTGNTATGFTTFTSFSITSGFAAGLNTLDFIVDNAWRSATGLRTEMTGTATGLVAALDAQAAIPEPASLTLLGLGGVMAGLLRRRRRPGRLAGKRPAGLCNAGWGVAKR